MRTRLSVLAVAALVLVAAPALAAKPPAPVSITLDQVSVTTLAGFTTVTMKVTNTSTVSVKIETNVEALLCADPSCDLGTTMNECSVAAIQGGSGSLGAGKTADFTVIFALGSGDYLFAAKVVGVKSGVEDRKQAVVGATL